MTETTMTVAELIKALQDLGAGASNFVVIVEDAETGRRIIPNDVKRSPVLSVVTIDAKTL